MQITKIPYWTNTRHYLIDNNFNIVCITDSIIVVNLWIKKYGIKI